MNYFRQTYKEMREQPLASWLAVAGTAFAIFLIMTVFTVGNLRNSHVAPESEGGRVMMGEGVHLTDTVGYESSGTCLSKKWAEKLYGDLDGVEKVSYSCGYTSDADANVAGKPGGEFSLRKTDNVYWDIFDFKFLEGKPFTKAESDAGMNLAVLTEKAAKEIFGRTDVTGKEFLLDHTPYRVKGVIGDVSPILTFTYADIFIPVKEEPGFGDNWMSEYFGAYNAILLKKPGVSDEHIKRQVEKRYAMLDKTLKRNGQGIQYHGTPYNVEELSQPHGSNTTPDTSESRRNRIIAYAVLILLPAINLSGMTNSRLRRRVSEIGVRRAFGASRAGIIRQLLTENMIVTLIGGLLGLVMSFLFLYFFSSFFVDLSADSWMSSTTPSATPTFGMMFTWSGFWAALLFCLVLNLASAGLPVWKASGTDPAEAISGNENEHK